MSSREFPTTYMKFEGRKVVDGKRQQYWVQDATEDMFDEIMYNLMNHFIGDEPATKYLNCKDDPASMEEFRSLWRKILDEKLTIVCLTKDAENNIKLAGFNILAETKADDSQDYQLKGKATRSLFKIFEYMEGLRNFYQEFNLKSCIKAMGLFVLPDYRGEGLGDRILEAREFLCKNVGVLATLTAFTSVISQKLAARVGFKDFVIFEYQKLGEIDPEMLIPDIHKHSTYMKYMYKLYD